MLVAGSDFLVESLLTEDPALALELELELALEFKLEVLLFFVFLLLPLPFLIELNNFDFFFTVLLSVRVGIIS